MVQILHGAFLWQKLHRADAIQLASSRGNIQHVEEGYLPSVLGHLTSLKSLSLHGCLKVDPSRAGILKLLPPMSLENLALSSRLDVVFDILQVAKDSCDGSRSVNHNLKHFE